MSGGPCGGTLQQFVDGPDRGRARRVDRPDNQAGDIPAHRVVVQPFHAGVALSTHHAREHVIRHIVTAGGNLVLTPSDPSEEIGAQLLERVLRVTHDPWTIEWIQEQIVEQRPHPAQHHSIVRSRDPKILTDHTEWNNTGQPTNHIEPPLLTRTIHAFLGLGRDNDTDTLKILAIHGLVQEGLFAVVLRGTIHAQDEGAIVAIRALRVDLGNRELGVMRQPVHHIRVPADNHEFAQLQHRRPASQDCVE